YCVQRITSAGGGQQFFARRELSDQRGNDECEPGFLYFNMENPWPRDETQVLECLPDDWLEEHRGFARVRPNRRKDLPEPVCVSLHGEIIGEGMPCHFVKAPFRFCLHCLVAYGFRSLADFGKLATLGSEGRSTATTILSLSAIRSLREESALPDT